MEKDNLLKIVYSIMPYVVILISVVLIRTFIATPVIVNGSSMAPTLKNSNILLLNKFNQKIKRFDIVVLNENKDKLIKRIIGLPGETVEYKGYHLYINGKKINDKFAIDTGEFYLEDDNFKLLKIPVDKYFVLGDNRNNSIDSRSFGLVDKNKIDGIVKYSLLPFKKL